MYCSTASEYFFYKNVSRSRTQSALRLVWRRPNFSHFTPFFALFSPLPGYIGENTKAQIGVFTDNAVLYGVIKVCTQFPPYILFKRRQGTRQFHPKKFIQVGAKTNRYQQFSCTYNQRLELLTKQRHWKTVSRGFQKRRRVSSLKTLTLC